MSLKERLTQIQIEREEEQRKKLEADKNKHLVTLKKEEQLKKVKIHRHLVSVLKKYDSLDDEKVKEIIEEESRKMLSTDNYISELEIETIIEQLKDDLLGFGPINSLLKDKEVTEVMVNGPKQVYVEKNGKLQLSNAVFANNKHVLQVIDKIVAPLGRRIDESSPMVDARLPDGSRVNAIIPPLAIDGPSITIRKFPESRLTIKDYINFGSISPEMAEFLKGCVYAHLNVVISGGTGSGKTTLLNIASSFIPSDERIVTIEDAAELQLHQPHVVRLETRPPNIEGKGQISIRELVKNSLRMRPDRIVVGEVRGGEALDMLQAMNTGHDGSLATGHANSPRDMMARLETMVLMAGMDLPVRAIREQISSAVDIIVQQARLKDGSRKIVKITEVTGMEGDTITLQDIFVFKQTGISPEGKIQGRYLATGIRPNVMEKLVDAGVNISNKWFL